jgi:hypothetical protein
MLENPFARSAEEEAGGLSMRGSRRAFSVGVPKNDIPASSTRVIAAQVRDPHKTSSAKAH